MAIDFHARRNAMAATVTASTFFGATVEHMQECHTRHDGTEWIHPVSGDELAKLKAGVSLSQQPAPVDPLG